MQGADDSDCAGQLAVLVPVLLWLVVGERQGEALADVHPQRVLRVALVATRGREKIERGEGESGRQKELLFAGHSDSLYHLMGELPHVGSSQPWTHSPVSRSPNPGPPRTRLGSSQHMAQKQPSTARAPAAVT